MANGSPADQRYEALLAERAEALDALVRSVAGLMEIPIALVTVIESENEPGAIRVVARHGLDLERTAFVPGLCAAAAETDGLHVVGDTHEDPTARSNPLVTGPPGVRFYAGAPIHTPDGRRVGNLCVLDTAPRELSDRHAVALVTLADLVSEELRLRAKAARVSALERQVLRAVEQAQIEAGRFLRLADSMPLLVWIANATGGVTYVNPALRAYLALGDDADLDGKHLLANFHPDDQLAVVESWERSLATGEYNEVESRLRRHDGEHRWHQITAFPVTDDDGTVVAWFGAATDVHDRRTAELALADRERYLRAILENEPECVKIVSPDGDLLEMNPAGLAMVDATDLAEVRGQDVTRLIHHDDVARYADLHRRATQGEHGTAVFRTIGLHGTERWMESNAVPLDRGADGRFSVLSVTRDITARRRAEMLQQAEAEILEQLVSGAPLGAVLHRIVASLDDVNGGASAILLVDGDRLRRGAAVHLPEDSVDELDGMVIGPEAGSCGAAVATGSEVVSTDLVTDPHWDGRRDTIVAAGFAACTSTPVADSSGRVVAVIAQYLRDPRPPSDDERAATARAVRLVGIAVERIRTDTSLRQTTTLLRLASRLGHLGGWSVEVLPTGSLADLVWSDEVAAIHDRPAGYQPSVEEAIGYYAPEYRHILTDAFTACVERGVPYDIEAEIVSATGYRRWCRTVGQAERDATGRIVRVAGAFQDISAYKESERAMRESEERFRLVARATSDVVFDWNLLDDTVWYSEDADEVFGLDVGAAERRRPVAELLRERLDPDDYGRVAAGLKDAIDRGATNWADAFRVARPDGRVVRVEATGHLLRDPSGRAERLIGSVVDVTLRHELEHQLAQAQRLEAVGQLTGGVAHDFNNLLTVILGNAELLDVDLVGGDPPDLHDPGAFADLAESVAMIRSAAERGGELTARLLAFARRQPLEPVVVQLPELIDGLIGMLRRTLGEHVHIEVRHAPDTWTAMVDPAQLETAVLNICLNARDAMPGGGRLTIETVNVELPEGDDTVNGLLDAGEYVVLAVVDTGAGMPAEVVEHAFDPFFTTKAPGSGTGLGLSMVYGFARQSRGHAQISSEPGIGTTVRLYLPRADPDAAAGLAVSPTRERVGGHERILLVEDDPLVREVARAQLRSLGYEVVEAGDGPGALDALRTAGPFDLLFTDVVMPGGMNGPQLAEVARRDWPDLPVLFTSGYTEDAVVHDGRLDPGVELLNKPYRLHELAERVRRVLDRAGR